VARCFSTDNVCATEKKTVTTGDQKTTHEAAAVSCRLEIYGGQYQHDIFCIRTAQNYVTLGLDFLVNNNVKINCNKWNLADMRIDHTDTVDHPLD